MNKRLIDVIWLAALPFLSLHAQSYASAAMPAEGDSTSAGNQPMRVMTFKAVPGTARTYYYHRDHLGSTTLITNKSGEVVQRVEYLPTGETFIEQQDTTWTSPYKFNGKELDEETGLYYYGARYYDPRQSMWLGTDPMQGKYPGICTYAFCHNNPVRFIDYDGKDAWILVWATQSSDGSGVTRIGHTSVVVENFNNSFQSTGTYTYYDLWPLSAKLGGKAAVQDVAAVYNSQSFYMTTNGVKNTDYSALERYMSSHDMSQLPGMLQNNFLENSRQGYGEGYAPDGIIRLGLNGEQTYKLQQEYISLIRQGSPYNGESNNCTTFVANGINNSGVGSIKKEAIIDWRGILVNFNPFHQSFTPNNTYNQLKSNPNYVVVKSAGNKTSESYEDAIIDR